jgi:hypothetical protein
MSLLGDLHPKASDDPKGKCPVRSEPTTCFALWRDTPDQQRIFVSGRRHPTRRESQAKSRRPRRDSDSLIRAPMRIRDGFEGAPGQAAQVLAAIL